MELTDQIKIDIAIETIKEVVEPLFWKLEDCIYKSDETLAKAIHMDFVYLAKYNPSILKQGLRSQYLKRLKEITMDLYGGINKKDVKGIKIMDKIPESFLPFKKEAELRDYLELNFNIIQDKIGYQAKLYGKEVPLEEGFKCDLVAEDKDIVYLIELKIELTDHGVISQMNKYLYYMYRRLRYGLYKDLQGIVIAPGFDHYSLNELRKDGVWCYTVGYSSNDKTVSIKEITS